jgi:hypothetical protein
VDVNCTENCTYTRVHRLKDSVDDASAGMAIVLLLFIIPKTFTPQGSKSGIIFFFF